MSRTCHLFTRIVGLATAVVIGNFALFTAAAAQTTSAELPVDCSAYSTVPLPAEAEKVPVPKTPPSCASYRSYRGLGRPVNYAEARACAWQERLAQKAHLWQSPEEPFAWVVGGSLILTDIYFNGAGVKRNIPLAMRFACEWEEGAATVALPAMAKLSGSPSAHQRFELCDYAASTFTINFCGGYKSQIENDRRERYYNSLKPSMTPEQQAAFDKLLAAQKAYIDAHASEVDQGGTIRVMRTIGSQTILKNLFHAELVQFERKKWPALSANQIARADVLLRREYEQTLQRIRTKPKDDIYEGAVTADGVSSVERAWEIYREAWVAFARLRYPDAVDAIRAQISLDRYRLLKTMP